MITIEQFSENSQLAIKELCNAFGYSVDEFPNVFNTIANEIANKKLAEGKWFFDIGSACLAIGIIIMIIRWIKHSQIKSIIQKYITDVHAKINDIAEKHGKTKADHYQDIFRHDKRCITYAAKGCTPYASDLELDESKTLIAVILNTMAYDKLVIIAICILLAVGSIFSMIGLYKQYIYSSGATVKIYSEIMDRIGELTENLEVSTTQTDSINTSISE